ncbi:acyl-CoA N-acyltransferase [Pyrenochaeta sp. DS3sAY3a]|nr:acyl-CoA N-acyltransferase [Pyrenochaeta sp. DS3sAY3a]
MATPPPPPDLSIRPATFPSDLKQVTVLFRAYAASLPIPLDFQNFEHEVASLPGKYGEDRGGAVFLAFVGASGISGSQQSEGERGGEGEGDVSTQEAEPIGCIAIRYFSASTPPSPSPSPSPSQPPPPRTCELKRLYLSPSSRGLGAGKQLLDAAIQKARSLGYAEMLLDTLGSMVAARRLYEKAGFEEIESYYESVEGAVFYRLRL